MTTARTLLIPPLLAWLAGATPAQAEPPNGPRQVDARWHAFVHAKLVAAPGETVDDATIVIRDGVIVSAGAAAPAPEGATAHESAGLWIYPGFVEPFLEVDAPAVAGGAAQADWNPRVTPQRSGLAGPGVDAKVRAELRGLGFAAAAIAPRGGVFRGLGALVLLDEPGETEGTRQTSVVRERVYHAISFDRDGAGYPRSLMGCVAVVRQTLYDALWYAHNQDVFARHPAGNEPPPLNAGLAVLGTGGADGLPLLFDVGDELEALVALRTARELQRPALVLGTGTDYRRLAALAQEQARLIVPLAFPEAPDVASVAAAERSSLRDLMAWEQAPTNPRRIEQSGLAAALTTHRLEKREQFLPHLRRAIRHGLTPDAALAMLTTRPAEMLGADGQIGTVAAGKLANLIVTDGPLFEPRTRILDVWIRGQRHRIHDPALHALEGSWSLAVADPPGFTGTLQVGARKRVTLEIGGQKVKARNAVIGARSIDFVLEGEGLGRPGAFALNGWAEGEKLFGSGRGPDGAAFSWQATRASTDAAEPEEPDPSDDPSDVPDALPTPLGAFGLFEPPPAQDFVVKNATLWGGGQRFSVAELAFAVRDGKIAWIGESDLADRLAEVYQIPTVIDATGKHITPGLIDCHSHTGIAGGVNEGTQAVTSEVRIADALDPDDINWYRQLAGGVTAVQQLHGSANPIGGQSSVVKLRWGVTQPVDMVMRGAPPGIKFALGENVKRPGAEPQTRYPGSRMGVEALIRDRFSAAREYSEQWQRYRRLPPEQAERAMQPRRDLELDALAEVLGEIRLVHCHSYRQDEILMLCGLAGEFDFKVGTFQHGLEGYKVAEAIREHAIGASVFSDWWAYKFEVIDAIPYNGEILFKTGVAVSFNSDSNELARRLNTEAAKAVKYGGLAPNDALSFVTLGPAKQLGVDNRIGSLERAKEADFAIWSDDPLSGYARCEATYIDGRAYFSLAHDQELRAWAAAERQRIVQKLLRRPPKPEARGDGDADAEPGAPRAGAHAGTFTADERGVCGCIEREGDR